jgi:nucleotide-binding universal stress UspA family protein
MGVSKATWHAVAGPDTGRLVLMARADGPTGTWAAGWSRAAGYELVTRSPVEAADVSGGPIVGGRLTADIAASNHAGASVLLHRGSAIPPKRRRTVAALGDLPADEAVLLHAAACAAALGGPLMLVHAVPVSFGERSIGLDAAVAHGEAVLATASALLAGKEPEVEVVTRLVRSRAHEEVAAECTAALLVLGGARVGSGDPLGLVALSAVHHAGCPMLLVPR